jgi:hypothetical protein
MYLGSGPSPFLDHFLNIHFLANTQLGLLSLLDYTATTYPTSDLKAISKRPESDLDNLSFIIWYEN